VFKNSGSLVNPWKRKKKEKLETGRNDRVIGASTRFKQKKKARSWALRFQDKALTRHSKLDYTGEEEN